MIADLKHAFFATFEAFFLGLWIRILFNPDPDLDPAFFVNPDLDQNQIRIQIQTKSRFKSKPNPDSNPEPDPNWIQIEKKGWIRIHMNPDPQPFFFLCSLLKNSKILSFCKPSYKHCK
jgi:hypothetical protein